MTGTANDTVQLIHARGTDVSILDAGQLAAPPSLLNSYPWYVQRDARG